jgi:phosphoribosylformylglycinamidine cyclo-ligase
MIRRLRKMKPCGSELLTASGGGTSALTEMAEREAGELMEIKGANVLTFSGSGTAHDGPMTIPRDAYKESGVDTPEADAGLSRLVHCIKETWPQQGIGRVLLPIGYFANVIDMDGIGLALCTDGVGSKTIIADRMRKYDTIGIDCIAMNVNDMICVGAKPLSLVDYIAIERADAAMLAAIGVGLRDGARMANISISGGEIAQLKDIVRGFDLVGMAAGRVALDKVLCGREVTQGDVVIGVRSNGVHSNGLSLARRAFFEDHTFGLEHKFDDLDTTLGEELIRPTHIYVREAMEILETVRGVKALINITSDGLLNLARVDAAVGFEIDNLIERQPIFSLIQHYASVPDTTMFEVFNMGIGFCYVVESGAVDQTMAILKRHGRHAQRIGHAVADPDKTVRVPQRKLVGKRKTFVVDEHAALRAG